jgi:hypothetical protein
MLSVFVANLPGPRARERGIALVSVCVGAMVVARAVDDQVLADAFRKSARKHVLAISGWGALSSRNLIGAAAGAPLWLPRPTSFRAGSFSSSARSNCPATLEDPHRMLDRAVRMYQRAELLDGLHLSNANAVSTFESPD